MIRALLVLVMLPNLVLSVVAHAANAPRALVNLDYVAVFLADAIGSRALTMTVISVVLLLDVAFTVAPAFNFGPSEVVQAVSEIRHFSGRTMFVAFVVIAVVILAGVGLVLLRGRPRTDDRRRRVTAAIAFGIGAIALDFVNGSNAVTWRPRPILQVDVTESMFVTRYAASDGPPAGGKVASETDELRAEIARAAAAQRWDGPNKIVLVIVESMGVPRSATAMSLFGPLAADSVTRRFNTRAGTVPAFGSTTTGELRALCGVLMNHFSAQSADLRCLPHELSALGFESIALHGYNGSLFQRTTWYPRVGFSRMRFEGDLRATDTLATCGTVFHGVCDSSMTRVIRQELTREPGKRQFVYWLTLSSHFPIDPRAGASEAACAALGRVGREREVCALWRALWPALSGVASLAADSTVPPAWYIIAGDHEPPGLFSDTSLFLQRQVPFLELRPKVPGR